MKKRKNFGSVIAAAALVCAAVFAFVCGAMTANAATEKGVCGDGLVWTLDGGTLTISGEGEMESYPMLSSPWCGKDIREVIVKSGVKSIGYEAFVGCESLERVSLPEGLECIEEAAFYECCSLSEINFPSGLKCIGREAFYCCEKLTKAHLPSGVTCIGDSAFESCEALADVTLPDGIEEIGGFALHGTAFFGNAANRQDGALYVGSYLLDVDESVGGSFEVKSGTTIIADYAFNGCENITGISIPESVAYIGSYAFERCGSLTEISLPESIDRVGYGWFSGCTSLESIAIPDGVTEICDEAFDGCVSLENITLPENVTYIGRWAFHECSSLKEINIPESVTEIGEEAFFATAIYYDRNNWEDDVLYIGDCAVMGNSVVGKQCVLKNGTRLIADSAFEGSINLVGIEFPDTLRYIGNWAFSECNALEKVNIPEGVLSIGSNVFYDCTALESAKLPESLEDLGDGAFHFCKSLIEVNIPCGIDSIKYDTFYGCAALESIAIPANIKEIGNHAFTDCSALRNAYYTDTKQQWSNIIIGEENEPLTGANIHFLALAVNTARLAGGDRIETAVAISKEGWKSSDSVIVACGMNYADALAAVPLSAALDCPILLTQNLGTGLETSVKAEIERLGASGVYIVGGEYVVSKDIENALEARYDVVRLAGAERYETSMKIAKALLEIRKEKGLGDFTNVYFCSAGSFADALAISPVAGIELNPILYAPATGSSLKGANEAMYDFVGSLEVENTTVIGGVYAVSDAAAADLREITGKAPVRVDAGLTGGRYETMLEVCKKYDSVFDNKNAVCVATGANFPDALAGAAFAAKNRCPMILVGYTDAKNTKTSISDELKNYVKTKSPLDSCRVFGGAYAVPDQQIYTLLGGTAEIK